MEMKENILQSLRAAFEHNNGIIFQELYIQQKWEPSIYKINKNFGTFSDALHAAGLEMKYLRQDEVIKKYDIPQKVIQYLGTIDPFKKYVIRFSQRSVFIDKEIIQDLKAFFIQNQKLYKQYEQDPNYKPTTINTLAKIAGKSMKDLKEEIGEGKWEEYLVVIPKYQKSYYLEDSEIENNYFIRKNAIYDESLKVKQMKSEIIDTLREAYKQNNGLLASHIYKKQRWKPGLTTITSYFNGFNDAFKAAGLEVKYLRRADIVDEYQIPRRTVDYLIKQEQFKEYVVNYDGVIYVPTSILPTLKTVYLERKELYHKYNNNQAYLPIMNVVRLLDSTLEEVVKQLNDEKWKGWFISIPKYQNPEDDSDFHYFFKKSAFDNYASLEAIAKKSGFISSSALHHYAKKGFLPESAKLDGTRLYHINAIIEAIPKIKETQLNTKIEKINNHQKAAFNYLSTQQKQVITKYLTFREKGGVVDFNGYKTRGYISNAERTLKVIKSNISNLVLELILERSDITLGIEEFKKLDSIPSKFETNKFDITSINHEDYYIFAKDKSFKTLRHYYQTLKPFFYYMLQTKESEAVLSDQKYRQFLFFKINVMNFLSQFPENELSVSQTKRGKHRPKAFLTRDQMISVKELLLNDPLSRDNVKNATIWQICCSVGIRPEELHNVKIEHFLLDENGLLQLNNRGWGILDLPAESSKKGISPSHELYKTPIPPETVVQINRYLEYIYKRQGQHNDRGKGYLFRPHYLYPDYQYKSGIKKDFLKRIRNDLSFLSTEQKENFILKSARHSLNNLIDGYEVILPYPKLNGKVQKIAADYQMRHKPNVSALFSGATSSQRRDMGEAHYTDVISEDSFYSVLECTIDFPWNRQDLELWEIKNGYREHDKGITEELAASVETEENSLVENEHLTLLEAKFYKLKKARPKGQSVREWMEGIRRLEKELNKLKVL